jgi:hypothetical protein
MNYLIYFINVRDNDDLVTNVLVLNWFWFDFDGPDYDNDNITIKENKKGLHSFKNKSPSVTIFQYKSLKKGQFV